MSSIGFPNHALLLVTDERDCVELATGKASPYCRPLSEALSLPLLTPFRESGNGLIATRTPKSQKPLD